MQDKNSLMIKEERKKKLISYAENYPINDIPGINSLLTEDHTFVRVSVGGLKLSGFNNEDEMYDLGYPDIKCDSGPKCHKIWEADEKVAMKEKKTIRIISYANFNNGWKVLLGHQKPIIDKETNLVLGITTNLIDITENSFFDIGRLIMMENGGLKRKQFQYRIQDNSGFEGLTKREQEVLFWYNHFYSLSEISIKLSEIGRAISPGVVSKHIERIKLKLGVKTRSQLLEKSISIGFMCTVPESLFVE